LKQPLVIRSAEVAGRVVDVRIEDGRIVAVTPPSERPAAPGPGDDVVDAHGGALLPGLHDHHIHLLSLAAAARSVRVGPADVAGAAGLAGALEAADAALEPERWIRAVGYHESVAGPLDRDALDRIVPDRPVRMQHRSGALWVLNSAAVRAVGVDSPSGQLYGLDGWLAARVPHEPLDLAAVGRELLDCGVTGVTDATPTERREDLELLAGAVAEGALPQEVVVMGGPGLDPKAGAELERGPVKLVVADHRLPELDGLAAAFDGAHRAGRAVAVHCVTRVGILLALAAWDEAGAMAGDRVEHGAVVHPEEAARIAAHGLTVVTQPGFVAERGDDYLADVDPEDRPYLWRCAGLLEAGIAVAGSTDAPLGPFDPWQAIAAATTRRTPAGAVLGGEERVDARRALALFLGRPGAPGGAARRVIPGAPADLCLLAAPLEEALQAPSASLVVATIRRGHLTTPNRNG
jgi:predicted amidohydrolase YtcJ